MRSNIFILLTWFSLLLHTFINTQKSPSKITVDPAYNENGEIDKFLAGHWMSDKLLKGLKTGNIFTHSDDWIGPVRSFTFRKKNGKLNLVIETAFEMFDSSLRIRIDKKTNSIYEISLLLKNGKLFNKWEFDKHDSSISIPHDNVITKYIKYTETKINSFQPLPFIYNWTLLQGNYRVSNSNGEIVADNVIIDHTLVKNMPEMKEIWVAGDAEMLLSDPRGNKYIGLLFNKKLAKNSYHTTRDLTYRKENEVISLYDFTLKDPSKLIIDSVHLKYKLSKK